MPALPSLVSAEAGETLASGAKIVSSTKIAKENDITNGYVNYLAKKLCINCVSVDEYGRKYYTAEDAGIIASKLFKNRKNKVTVKELSSAAGVSEKTVRNSIKRTIPGTVTNGVQTSLTETEATLIVDELQNNNTVKARIPLLSVESLSSLTTEMTPALKLVKAQQMMAEAYEALLAYERAEKARLQVANDNMAEKCTAYDAITDSRDAIPMADCAKVLAVPGIGRNKLFDLLRQWKILQYDNTPYQKYVDAEYFRVIEQKYTTPDGETHINFKTLVFQRGVEYIRKQLIIHGIITPAECCTPEAIADTADKIVGEIM